MRYAEIIAELDFKGSACSVDCSGHQAGYNWAKRNPNKSCASKSPSFTKGCNIAKREMQNQAAEQQ